MTDEQDCYEYVYNKIEQLIEDTDNDFSHLSDCIRREMLGRALQAQYASCALLFAATFHKDMPENFDLPDAVVDKIIEEAGDEVVAFTERFMLNHVKVLLEAIAEHSK